jgi:hypothetical protein
MPTSPFDVAEADFQRFAVTHGYPATLLWTVPDELVSWRGRFIVLDGDAGVRRERARKTFERGAAKNVGIVIEGKCNTDRFTICGVYIADDQTDAENRMIPESGIKLSLSQNEFSTVLVNSRLLFAALRWWRRRKWAQPDWW